MVLMSLPELQKFGITGDKGRLPISIDNTKSPSFSVMETSAELLYLLKEYDSKDMFGFKDELERSQCLQWLFFWHESMSTS